MTLLLPASRRGATDFARDLDLGTVNDPVALGLLRMRQQLAALPLGPNADFRAALRYRLLDLASEPAPVVLRSDWRETANAALAGWRAPRRAAFASGLLAVLLVLGGIGLLGSRSLPGDPLYGVKRMAENVQLAAAHGDLAKGHRHLEFAATRLREATALVGRGETVLGAGPNRPVAGGSELDARTSRLVAHTLSDMHWQILAGTRDLTQYSQQSGNKQPLKFLAAFASQQQTMLGTLVATNALQSTAAQAIARRVMTLLTAVKMRATELSQHGSSAGVDSLGPVPCPTTCPAVPPGPSPAANSSPVSPSPSSSPSTSPGASPAQLPSPTSGNGVASPTGTVPSAPVVPTPTLAPPSSPVDTGSPTPSDSSTPSDSPYPPDSSTPSPTAPPSTSDVSPTDTTSPVASQSPPATSPSVANSDSPAPSLAATSSLLVAPSPSAG